MIAGAVVSAVLAAIVWAWWRGGQSVRVKRDTQDAKQYKDTRQRMDDVRVGDAADARQRMRNRGPDQR